MTRPVIWSLLVDYRPVIPRPAVGLSRRAWRTACQAAGLPTRFLHDCRRIAARNLIRASVPERVTMLLTGHKTRAIFDRDNIIHERELLEAGDLARTRPTDRILTCPFDMTLVGRGRNGTFRPV